MACVLTTGYSLGCRDNSGGVAKVFIASYDGTITYTLATDGTVSTMVPVSPATVPDFLTHEQDNEVASFNQTGQFSTENGTAFYEQTLEITMLKADAVMINRVKALGRGAWRIMVLDHNGNYYLMGKENPVRVTASTVGTGKAFGDLNGVKVTFTGKEADPAPLVDPAFATTVIA